MGIAGLFVLNHDRESRPSRALWIPVLWLAISSSRMVSLWLGISTAESVDQLVEGSPLDALIFAALLAAGLGVLVARRERTLSFLFANGPLLLFLLYCGVSIIWSDFPLVAFKRWTKALGDMVMIVIVLTDGDPVAARKSLLARVGFVLIPVSILLIRYYPALGRSYSPWTGTAYNHGVATGKNGLGFICLIFGLASVWRLFEEIRAPRSVHRTQSIVAHLVIVVFVLWLFQMANSATSLACFILGCTIMFVTNLRAMVRRPALVHVVVAIMLFLVLYGLLLNPDAGVVEMAGRNPTLTGRTALWGQILPLVVNPVFGAGYESFWLGERLETIWSTNWEHPNQAHNGYLEVYLDLGWVGVALLALLITWGYRNAIGLLSWDPAAARLGLAYFVAALAYNLTEHAFREIHPVWIAFLLAVTAIPRTFPAPEPAIDQVHVQATRAPNLQVAADCMFREGV